MGSECDGEDVENVACKVVENVVEGEVDEDIEEELNAFSDSVDDCLSVVEGGNEVDGGGLTDV